MSLARSAKGWWRDMSANKHHDLADLSKSHLLFFFLLPSQIGYRLHQSTTEPRGLSFDLSFSFIQGTHLLFYIGIIILLFISLLAWSQTWMWSASLLTLFVNSTVLLDILFVCEKNMFPLRGIFKSVQL